MNTTIRTFGLCGAAVALSALSACAPPGGILVNGTGGFPQIEAACAQLAADGSLRTDNGVPSYVEVSISGTTQDSDLQTYRISGSTLAHGGDPNTYEWTCVVVLDPDERALTAELRTFQPADS
jgi:hypothetical protein